MKTYKLFLEKRELLDLKPGFVYYDQVEVNEVWLFIQVRKYSEKNNIYLFISLSGEHKFTFAYLHDWVLYDFSELSTMKEYMYKYGVLGDVYETLSNPTTSLMSGTTLINSDIIALKNIKAEMDSYPDLEEQIKKEKKLKKSKEFNL